MIREASYAGVEGGRMDVMIAAAGARPEIGVAREILSFLPEEVVLREQQDPGSIRYQFVERMKGWKLREITFAEKSLRRLVDDPNREIKIDYIRREIERAAPARASWTFPRLMIVG